MKLLVTGRRVHRLGRCAPCDCRRHEVVNLDALTYAANPANLDSVAGSERYAFEQVDIRDRMGRARPGSSRRTSPTR